MYATRAQGTRKGTPRAAENRARQKHYTRNMFIDASVDFLTEIGKERTRATCLPRAQIVPTDYLFACLDLSDTIKNQQVTYNQQVLKERIPLPPPEDTD